jgi:hypothetical protein
MRCPDISLFQARLLPDFAVKTRAATIGTTAMEKMSNNMIGVDQGESLLFSDFQHGGQMWTGSGDRERRQRVTFSENFNKRPVVHCSVSLWDVDSTANVRADVTAECVDDAGFDIVFRTWGDTRIARARIGWMAIGEIRDKDHWDV